MSISRCFISDIVYLKYGTALLVCDESNLMDWIDQARQIFFRIDRVCPSKSIRALSRKSVPDRISVAYHSLDDVCADAYSVILYINGKWQECRRVLDKVSDGGFVVVTQPFNVASDIVPHAPTVYDATQIIMSQLPEMINYKILQNMPTDLHYTTGKNWVYYALLQKGKANENHTCNCG